MLEREVANMIGAILLDLPGHEVVVTKEALHRVESLKLDVYYQPDQMRYRLRLQVPARLDRDVVDAEVVAPAAAELAPRRLELSAGPDDVVDAEIVEDK